MCSRVTYRAVYFSYPIQADLRVMRSPPSPHDHKRSSQHTGSSQRTQATEQEAAVRPSGGGLLR
jgi:hypothetical protein